MVDLFPREIILILIVLAANIILRRFSLFNSEISNAKAQESKKMSILR